ncbi:hypothetical protein MHBO_003742 [Bonamia ostreae]|uniref:Uncharacterized protein n=1 Tax=Bonamia ostreae TaxID=126728 RepID=A0ABV2ARF0_9EUKA
MYISLKGYGAFYISLLEKSDSITTTTGDSHLVKDIDEEAKMEHLHGFVDIGLKLKHLSKTPYKSKRDREQIIADIKGIAYTLKKVSMTNMMTLEFSIINFPYFSSNSPLSLAYDVYMSTDSMCISMFYI